MARDRYIDTSLKSGRYRIKHRGRLVAFLVLILIIALAVFINSSYFNVVEGSVRISGDERYHFEDITYAAKDNLFGINIFKIDEDAIKQCIEDDNPYLEVVNIVRELPNKVEIVVKEREPVFQFIYNGQYYDVAENGVVMSDARNKDPALILVQGIAVNPIVRGTKIEPVNVTQFQDFEQLTYNLRIYDFMHKINVIDMTEESNIVMWLGDFKIIVGLPTQLQGKISCLSAAMDSVISQGHTTGVLDISVVGNIIFRKFDDEGAQNQLVNV
ncbi:MAG: FtsQ-type POTRA domain-containing protein [Clostridia bacterium]|nr:FtsQ-type POTRA domain-containing protein [Clostridia bacterium]